MLFSVIVPVYNVESYLGKCMQSLLAQGKGDQGAAFEYEIVLVDDGSTDGSGALCDSFAAENPGLVRVIHQDNKGLGGARNTGIAAARGEYILCVDSDDYIAEGALGRLADEIAKSRAEVYIFQFYHDRGNGSVEKEACDEGADGKPFALADRKDALLMLPAIWKRAWKTSLIRETGITEPERALYEDLRTTPKLEAKAKSIVILPDYLYYYLDRPGSIMNDKSALMRNGEIVPALEDLCGWFEEEGLCGSYEEELCGICIRELYIAASVRILRINSSDKQSEELLLSRLERYTRLNFPDYRKNKYVKALPFAKKTVLKLLEKKEYAAIWALFKIKG